MEARKIVVALALVCLVATMLVTCVDAAKPAKSTYLIGAIFDVTGPGSPLGTPERDTAQMVADQVNRTGGINGHPVKFIFADNGSEESKCATAAKKMIDSDRVKVIIGPSTTGPTLAIVSTCERAGIPLISCAAGNKITQPARPFVFKTAQSDTHAIAKVIDYLKSKRLTRVAFINDSNAFGSSGRQQMETQSARAGISLVAEESFGGKDPDMTAQLTRIKSKNPQAIVCWGTNPGPAILVRNARQLGIKTPIIMSHGVANKKFLQLAGPACNGVILPAGRLTVAQAIPSSDAQKQVLMAYSDQFKKTYGRDADAFGGYAWDASWLVINAMRKAGDNPAKIRAEIEKTKRYVGVSGIFGFAPTEHNGLSKDAFVLVKIQNMEWKLMK